MPIGVDTIKTVGRLVFDLERGTEKTSRQIDMANPIVDPENVQAAVNAANATYTNATNQMNTFIQPANWRDSNVTEQQWTTTGLRYEIVTTAITPVEPDEVVSAKMANEEEQHEQEQNDQQQNAPQGEWQG